MSLFQFNRQSVFLTPTPLFFALTGKRCRKSLMESTRDSGDFGGVRPAQSRTAFRARIPHALHSTWAHAFPVCPLCRRLRRNLRRREHRSTKVAPKVATKGPSLPRALTV